MAIKNLPRQAAERGKIKIGGLGDERKKQGKSETYRLPVKYDSFIITTMEKDEAGRFMADRDLMSAFDSEGGPKIPAGPYKGLPLIKEIPIRLLHDDNELNFPTRLARYQGSRCWCSGDAEKAFRLDDQGKYREVPCPCERLDPACRDEDRCKHLGTLQCLIDRANRVGGIWKFRTAGKNSVCSIVESMNMIKALTGGGQVDSDGRPVGPLAWIPLKMVVSPKSTSTRTGQPVIIHVVRLEFDGLDERLVELGFEIMRKRIDHRMQMGKLQKQLVAPDQESLEEQKETAEEFFPSRFSTEGEEAGQGAGTDHTDRNGEGSEIDPLNLDRSTAPEQVYTIPRETKRPEETVPPGYDGLTSNHPQTNGSKNGGRKSLGERLF
jgi:hypothetical protein